MVLWKEAKSEGGMLAKGAFLIHRFSAIDSS